MRFPIDVIFLGNDLKVMHVIRAMPPWRTSKIVRGAKMVVELPAGTLASSETDVGDTIIIEMV
jgi:uncharacterized membrane protein (UPF0127 family)